MPFAERRRGSIRLQEEMTMKREKKVRHPLRRVAYICPQGYFYADRDLEQEVALKNRTTDAEASDLSRLEKLEMTGFEIHGTGVGPRRLMRRMRKPVVPRREG